MGHHLKGKLTSCAKKWFNLIMKVSFSIILKLVALTFIILAPNQKYAEARRAYTINDLKVLEQEKSAKEF